MKPTLYLCGAGNPEGVRLALRLNEAADRWERILLLDDDPGKLGTGWLGVPVAGGFDLLGTVDPVRSQVASLVARTAVGRRGAAARIASFGVPWTDLVSPDVDLLGASVAPDFVAYRNAAIGPGSFISEGCVVFMGAAVGHESQLGAFSIVAANAVINARVTIGEGSYVGPNATVLPEIRIGEGAMIGAGAVVLDHVPPGSTVAGGACETSRPGEAPAPRGDRRAVEDGIRKIWTELLELEAVPPDRNFFDMGGNSLLALRLAGRIRTDFGVTLPLVEVFRCPTVTSLTARLLEPGGSGETTGAGLDQAARRIAARRRGPTSSGVGARPHPAPGDR
jgi:carbonic anhydrase/acetyltransferase-like protein (isoleucine patch superfamily)